MDKSKVKALLRQNEGPKLDFKEKLDLSTESGKKELAKDVLAIANTQGGRGHIILGIKDKSKEVVGVDPDLHFEERIQQVLALRCDPPVTVRAEDVVYENKILVVITIFRSYNKPHQMLQTGAFYLRRGSTTDMARRDEIAGMLQYNGMLSNEKIPLFNLSCEVLNRDLITQYLRKRSLEDQIDNADLLCELGIYHYDSDSVEYFPTMGSLLLFADEPEKYMPYLGIQIINHLGNGIETSHLGGNIHSLIMHLKDYFRQLEYTYPYDAIVEAAQNAILHRDYFDPSRSIVIVLAWDTVQVSNPGAIYGNERLSNIMNEPNPGRRNHWLYHQLLIFDDKKQFTGSGRGLKFIQNSFLEKGKVKFLNIRKTNTFKVIMPGFSAFKKEGL